MLLTELGMVCKVFLNHPFLYTVIEQVLEAADFTERTRCRKRATTLICLRK